VGLSLEPEEEISQVLQEVIGVLEEVSIERDLYKKMYETEKQAKEFMAVELEDALVKVARLGFYLENS